MILTLSYLVLLIAVGMLVAGLVLLYREHRLGATGRPPSRDHKFSILGIIDFQSDSRPLMLIVGAIVILAVDLPAIATLRSNGAVGFFETAEVTERKLRKKFDQIIPSSQRGAWLVSVSSCLVLPDEHDRLVHFLAGLGFTWTIDHAHRRDARTPNMATDNTVYFYHSHNKPAADVLARMLALQFDVPFSTTQGDGQGVPPERRAKTLIVHRIGETCKATD